MKTKIKKNKKNVRNRTCKIGKKTRCISIPINWNSQDSGFSDLKNEKVFKYLLNNLKEGYNLIQTQPDKSFYVNKKSTLFLQSIKFDSWPSALSWNKKNVSSKKIPLLCKSYNKWIKTTPCKKGKKNREKIFLKMKSNTYVGGFGVYLWRIFSGEINEEDHKIFVKALKDTFKNKPIYIHNTDVDWFHAKENN
tara:strand:+ start:2463 stop:3041 length:579 start_codon:yes stop_codon:yes gene_type:complete